MPGKPFRRTRHRGASQDEGEGKDEADGPHLMVSGFGLPALPAVFVGGLITNGCFRISAPKAENGFVARRIVSSRLFRRNIERKKPMISV